MPPEAEATRLLLLTLAIESADESELAALLDERAQVLALLEKESSLSGETVEILAKVETAERRVRAALDARRTTLAASSLGANKATSIPARYGRISRSTSQRVA